MAAELSAAKKPIERARPLIGYKDASSSVAPYRRRNGGRGRDRGRDEKYPVRRGMRAKNASRPSILTSLSRAQLRWIPFIRG